MAKVKFMSFKVEEHLQKEAAKNKELRLAKNKNNYQRIVKSLIHDIIDEIDVIFENTERRKPTGVEKNRLSELRVRGLEIIDKIKKTKILTTIEKEELIYWISQRVVRPIENGK